MEMLLERIEIGDTSTVGTLSIIHRVDDEYLAGEEKEFICDTLEPRLKKLGNNPNDMHIKVAIPSGRYPVVITYSQEHRRWLPQLLGVPKFKDVCLVVAKTLEEVKAGIIIGLYKGEGRIICSPNVMYELKRRIVEAKRKDEGVFLTVYNSQLKVNN